MEETMNGLAILWQTIWLIFVFIQISKGKKNSILYVYLTFYLFFTFPLIQDLLYGKPEYKEKIGLQLASRSETTSVLYAVYTSVVPIIWFVFFKLKSTDKLESTKLDFFKFEKFKPVLYLLLIAPLFLVLLSPDPGVYWKYGAVVTELFNEESSDYHVKIHLFSILSIISSVLLFLMNRKHNMMYLIYVLMPWVVLAMWLQGKRAIVAIFILMLGLTAIQKGLLKGWKIPLFGIVSALILVLFSSFYQENVRASHVNESPQVSYTNSRIDFGRDSVTKLAIYSELNKDEKQILEYRGQSLLFYLTMYVPRSMWESKPWPYPVYVTTALFKNAFSVQYLGWTVTTSWLEEAIANFGWFGMLLGPLGIGVICRTGDKSHNNIIRVLTVLIGSLLLVLPLNSFFPIFAIWIGLILLSRRRQPKAENENIAMKNNLVKVVRM
ncbi:hypothetical protein [Paenibacillus sp. 1P03SA]|uniref:hypothetical protein n=1 Tax=Paenibacillus sp. 1P03SA TaxID=3132294 RepID=UPI0039A3CE70